MPTASAGNVDDDRAIRIGQAAEFLGVSVETIRRWESDGRLATTRTRGGQRLVQIAENSQRLAQPLGIARILFRDEFRLESHGSPIAQSRAVGRC